MVTSKPCPIKGIVGATASLPAQPDKSLKQKIITMPENEFLTFQNILSNSNKRSNLRLKGPRYFLDYYEVT